MEDSSNANAALSEMQFADLQLQPGQLLQIELEGYQEEQRYRCVLMGYRTDYSIMMTAPAQNGLTITGLGGMTIKARLFSSHLNGVCAFEAKVLHLARQPYPYIHLSVPQKIYLGEVRKSVRATVNIISSVLHKTDNEIKKHSVCIVDLSTEGARITSQSLSANPGDEISLISKLTVSGVQRILKLTAIIRSRSDTDKKRTFGLQLVDISEVDRVMIHACVLSNLYKTPSANQPLIKPDEEPEESFLR